MLWRWPNRALRRLGAAMPVRPDRAAHGAAPAAESWRQAATGGSMRTLLLLALVAVLLGTAVRRAPADEREDQLQKQIAELDAALEKDKPEYAKAVRERIADLRALLAKADQVDVFKLAPRPIDASKQGTKVDFHGYEIVRRVRVGKAEQRRELAAFLGKALSASYFSRAACFNPRHGLRVLGGQRTVDLVICFECNRIKVYERDMLQGTVTVLAQKHEEVEQVLGGADEKPKETPKR
jgi:hypothetical protein